METGDLIGTLRASQHRWFRSSSSSGVFSPDGRTVAVWTYSEGIGLWDSVTGSLKTTLAIGDDCMLHEFSPDGKLFAIYRESKGWHRVTTIELHDSLTGELRSTLTGKNMRYAGQQRVWTSDSQTYITGGGDKKYEGKVWDVKTGRLKATFPMLLTYSRIPFDWGFNNRDELSVHPSLPVAMAANDKFIRFWSTDNGELIQRIDSTGGPAQWSADGTLLLTFGKKRKVAHVWRVVLPFCASVWPSRNN